MVNRIAVILTIAGFLFTGSAFSAQPKPDTKKAKAPAKSDAKKARKTVADMTTEEIIASIKDTLENEDEILSFIPNIKAEKDTEGRISYAYLEGAKELSMEELDREKLEKLLVRINQTATQIRTERINRQMEAIRQAQNVQRINAIQNMPKPITTVPVTPPKPPVTVTLPPVPPTQPQNRPAQPPPAPPSPPKR